MIKEYCERLWSSHHAQFHFLCKTMHIPSNVFYASTNISITITLVYFYRQTKLFAYSFTMSVFTLSHWHKCSILSTYNLEIYFPLFYWSTQEHVFLILPFFIFFCFGKEDRPCANICCHSSPFCLKRIVAVLTSVPIFLYFLYAGCRHSMAWWVVCRSMPGTWTCEPQASETECANLTTMSPGRPQSYLSWLNLRVKNNLRLVDNQTQYNGNKSMNWVFISSKGVGPGSGLGGRVSILEAAKTWGGERAFSEKESVGTKAWKYSDAAQNWEVKVVEVLQPASFWMDCTAFTLGEWLTLTRGPNDILV